MIPLSTNPLKSAKRYAMLVGIALCLAVLACTVAYVHTLKGKVEELQEDRAAAVADAAASDTYRRGLITHTTDRDRAKEATDDALDRNKDWADRPVPNDVAERLRNPKDAGR